MRNFSYSNKHRLVNIQPVDNGIRPQRTRHFSCDHLICPLLYLLILFLTFTSVLTTMTDAAVVFSSIDLEDGTVRQNLREENHRQKRNVLYDGREEFADDYTGHSPIPDQEGEEDFTFGLSGHGGLFRSLNWTSDELRHISLWHATAEYHKCVELVEKKMAKTSNLQPASREKLLNFIYKFQPPEVVRNLLNKKQRHQIKYHHRLRDVGKILEIFGGRLAKLNPDTRQQILTYLSNAANHSASSEESTSNGDSIESDF
ncbi:hypothetical protein DdX_09011 [Ditylenchus destructor]|uniref:Uncharacterized protein n=1 Tax=Ditylenchus destructor TaxID=166010 RepID=A0AAD4N1R0_9BILA|nr:hypothetical protein DdX_09011 [Ditylenchus destructor]